MGYRNQHKGTMFRYGVLVGMLLWLGGMSLSGVAEGAAARTKGSAAKTKGSDMAGEAEKTGAATSPGIEPGATGTIVADTGFRPTPNGFNFANYGGDQYLYGDLTADDARKLFGDQVCEYITKKNVCMPTPAAQLWIAEMNAGMRNGHCEGMAALSLLLFTGREKPTGYGGAQASDLDPANASLLREVATYWTMQTLEPVLTQSFASQQKTPTEILQTIIAGMRTSSEVYTLGVYGKTGGHAITPYAVEDIGNGKFWIHVYDNNYPGAGKYVAIDTTTNTWKYAGAALNPQEDAAPWEGSAGTLDLTPLSVRQKTLKCPFCGTTDSCQKPGDLMLVVEGKGSAARAKGSAARTKGSLLPQMKIENGKVINAIPGAIITRMKGSAARTKGSARRSSDRGTLMVLPPDQEYTVSVVGESNTEPEPASVAGFRGCAAFAIDGLILNPGQEDQLVISASGQGFSFIPGGKQSPTLTIGTTSPASRDGVYVLSNLPLGKGYPFTLFVDPTKGKLTVSKKDPNLKSFNLTVTTVKGAESQSVAYNNVPIGNEGQVMVETNPDGSVQVGIDANGDGIPDTSYAGLDNDTQNMFSDFGMINQGAASSSVPGSGVDGNSSGVNGLPNIGSRPGGPGGGQPRTVRIPVEINEQ